MQGDEGRRLAVNYRTTPTILLALAVFLAPAAAGARLAVVVPEDGRGGTLEYRGDLPPDPEGTVTFGWSYVADLVPLIVVGAELDDACDARHSPVIDDEVDEALRLMTGLEAERAVVLLDRLSSDLPCLDQPASSAELADIFYYRSAALAFLGEDKAARASMRRAVAIEPALEPDENLPETINDMLAEERSQRATTVQIRLRLGDMEVRLDGRDRVRELAEDGLGLLQWKVEGRWHTARLRDLRDTVVVATPLGMADRLQHAEDPQLLLLAAALGDALHEPLRIDRAVFWDGREGALLWDPGADETRWLGRHAARGKRGDGRGRPLLDGPDGGSDPVRDPVRDPDDGGGLPDLDEPDPDGFDWEDPYLPDLDEPDDPRGDDDRDPDRDPDPPPIEPRGSERDDRLRWTFGGGFMYLNPHPYALAGTDVGILLYGRLSLSIRADLGIPVVSSQRVRSMPLFGTGLRLRLGPRGAHVNPWLGLSFKGGVENLAGVLMGRTGASFEVGLDLVPARHLILRIAVDGGFLEQRGQVHAKIAVGFGV